jgi:hypothetical protein
LRLSIRSSPVRKVDDSPAELGGSRRRSVDDPLDRSAPDASLLPRREKRFFSLNGVGDRFGSRLGPERRARRLAASTRSGRRSY